MSTRGALSIALCVASFAFGAASNLWSHVQAKSSPRVFELRMYTVEDGKVELLSRVFRDHVTKMFAKHGMTNVAYFIPQDDPACSAFNPKGTILSPVFDKSTCQWSKDTLVYVLGHQSRSAAEKNWASFRNDAEGLRNFRQEYHRAGLKVMKIQTVYTEPTDYSALK
jgi:hypothetical protein